MSHPHLRNVVAVAVVALLGPMSATPALAADPPPITDPVITATVSSAKDMKRGWYRSAVRIAFECIPGSGTVTCPDPVYLRWDGRGQSVTRTIVADDGGQATVVVDGIDIDTSGPKVRVKGVRAGHTYKKARKLRCRANDRLSGLLTCEVRTKRVVMRNGDLTIRYRARAFDRAGNVAISRGKYFIDR